MSNQLPGADHGEQLVLPSMGDVVCFGFLTYCLLLVVETFPDKNDGAPVQETVESMGDDAALVASILSRWKVPTTFISSTVGDDYHGGKVMEQLRASGIDASHRVSLGATTPIEVAVVDGAGSRTYFQKRGPSAMASLPTPGYGQLAKARLLYVDWYDGPEVLGAMKLARSYGVPVFLNLESRYHGNPGLLELLRHANICQVSLDEPGASGDPADIARDLIQQGVGTVVITLGAEGCVAARAGQALYIRPPEVKVIDGYGAGAAFAAGVIYGLHAGWPLEESARFAAAHSGLKCGVTGTPPMQIRDVQQAAAKLAVRPLAL